MMTLIFTLSVRMGRPVTEAPWTPSSITLECETTSRSMAQFLQNSLYLITWQRTYFVVLAITKDFVSQ
jgi:hypothetical protein